MVKQFIPKYNALKINSIYLQPIPDLLTFKYQGIMTEQIYISPLSLIA